MCSSDLDEQVSGFESSSTPRSSAFIDDLDSGTCYHHQSANESTYSKYSDVVTELEDRYGTPSSTTTVNNSDASEETGKSSTGENSS